MKATKYFVSGIVEQRFLSKSVTEVEVMRDSFIKNSANNVDKIDNENIQFLSIIFQAEVRIQAIITLTYFIKR